MMLKGRKDALYRLTKAAGREHVSINADTEPEMEGYNPAQPSPEDSSAMRRYSRLWEYDAVGNILNLIHKANGNCWTRNYSYDANSNRLESTAVGQNTVNYSYNEQGSMAAMPHLQNMRWDFMERLSHVTRGTTEAYYSYDGNGERVRKVVEKNGITETRLYLGGFEIYRKYVSGSLNLERETLHIMDDKKRIAVVETKTIDNGANIVNPASVQRYQLGNNIESAAIELDENANIISYEEYYPYGETSYRAGRNIAEVGLKRYRYTGKEKDEESGLYYYGARYYACWICRWIATDPAWFVDGLNLYMYCRGNPVGLADPEGLEGKKNEEFWVETKEDGTQVLCGRRGGARGGFGEGTNENIPTPEDTNPKLPVNKNSNIFQGLGEDHYNKMHELLESVEGELGDLLRKLWVKYESDLVVDDIEAGVDIFKDNGVNINLEAGAKDSEWLKAYQGIFHEFFHNIDDLAYRKDKSSSSVGNEFLFGKTIEEESINISNTEIMEIEHLAPLDKAYLIDILGGARKMGKIDKFGHESKFWKRKNYLGLLSAETFANMAAAAVTNPNASNMMKEYLKKSYNMFEQILKKMVDE